MYSIGDIYQSSEVSGVVRDVSENGIVVETINSEGDVENIFIKIKY